MSFKIDALIKACHYLESDKVVDRKKNAEALKRWLADNEVVELLDQRSKANSKDINYTVIFKSVQGYLFKESELARSKLENQAASSKATSAHKLKEILTLLHTVVKVGNKSGPTIKCHDLVNSTLIILRRRFQSTHLAHSYLEVLISDVLVHRKYVRQISSKTYQELLGACSSLYLQHSSSHHVSTVQVMLAIKSLIGCIIAQCDPIGHNNLFEFFEDSISCIRNPSSVTEHLLWCLSRFMEWQVAPSRERVLASGGTILPPVTSFLQSKKSSGDGLVHAMLYCHLQVELHLGGSLDHQRIPYSEESWKETLTDLTTAMVSRINSAPVPSRRIAAMKQSSDDDVIVSFTSCLLHAIMVTSRRCIPQPDSQTSSTNESDQQDEIKLMKICDIFNLLPPSTIENRNSINTWMRVVDRMLTQYADDVKSDDVIACASSIHDSLMTPTSDHVCASAMQALISLLRVPSFVTTDIVNSPPVWIQLWECAKRYAVSKASVKSSCLSNAALDFMSALVSVNAKRDYSILPSSDVLLSSIWPLVHLSTTPTSSFVNFLTVCVSTQGVLERHRNSPLSSDEASVLNTRPLRCGVLKWLLSCKDVEADSSTSTQHSFNSTLFNSTQLNGKSFFKLPTLFLHSSKSGQPDATSLADLLTALCCKDAGHVIDHCVASSGEERRHRSARQHEDTRKSKVYIPEVCQYLKNLVTTWLSDVDEYIKSSQSTDPRIVHRACYSAQLLVAMATRWTAEDSLVGVSDVNEMLSEAIQLFTSLVSEQNDLYGADRCELVSSAWACLKKSVQLVASSSNSLPGVTSGLKASLLEAKHLAMRMTTNHMEDGASPTNEALSRNGSATQLTFDDDIPTQPVRKRKNRFVDGPSAKQACFGRPLTQHSTSQSTASASHIPNERINPLHQLHEEGLELLKSLMCDLHVGLVGELFHVIMDDFDVTMHHHVEFFLGFLQVFGDNLADLTDDDMKEVVEGTESVLRVYYQDQQLCAACLSTIPCVLERLVKGLMVACVEDVRKLLDVVVNLVDEGKCGHKVRMSLLHCFGGLASKCALVDVEKSSLLCKLTASRKFFSFLADDNICVAMTCADESETMLGRGKHSVKELADFYTNVFASIKEGRRELVKVVATACQSTCLKLDRVACYVRVMSALLSCSAHVLEREVALELCHFASVTSQYFTGKSEFFNAFHQHLVVKDGASFNQCSSGNDRFCANFLKRHLKYVLSRWDDLDAFPYQLFGCRLRSDFLHNYANDIIPMVIIRHNNVSITRQFDNKDAVQSFPDVIAMILASLHTRDGSGSRKLSRNQALKLIKEVEDVCHSGEDSSVIFALPEVVSSLLLCFHEELSTSLQPFQLDSSDITACLTTLHDRTKYAKPANHDAVTSLMSVMSGRRGDLQRFMLLIGGAISSAATRQEARRALQSYRLSFGLLESVDDCCHDNPCVSINVIHAMTCHIETLSCQISLEANADESSQLSSSCRVCIDLLHRACLSLSEGNIRDKIIADREVVLLISGSLAYLAHNCQLSGEAFGGLRESLNKFLYFILQNRSTQVAFRCVMETSPGLLSIIPSYASSKIDDEEVRIEKAETLCDFLANLLTKTRLSEASSLLLSRIIDDVSCAIVNVTASHSSIGKKLLSILPLWMKSPIRHSSVAQEAMGACLSKLGLQGVGGNVGSALPHDAPLHPIPSMLSCLYRLCMDGMPHTSLTAHQSLLATSQSEGWKRFSSHPSTEDLSPVVKHFLKVYTSDLTQRVARSPDEVPVDEVWDCCHDNHEQWVCDLTSSLLHNYNVGCLNHLKPICRISSELSATVLPLVCCDIMKISEKMQVHLVGRVNTFLTSAVQPEVAGSTANKVSLLCMLEVVEYLRRDGLARPGQSPERASRPKHSRAIFPKKERSPANKEIDYLSASNVALLCNQPCTAMLYVELWADKFEERICRFAQAAGDASSQQRVEELVRSRSIGTCSSFRMLQEAGGDGKEACRVVTSCYEMLNEVEGLRGCYGLSPLQSASLATLHAKEGRWVDALRANDLQASVGADVRPVALVRSLLQCGLHHVGGIYVSSLDGRQAGQELSELQYDAAWRCGDWDADLFLSHPPPADGGFHQSFFNLLSSIHDGQTSNSKIASSSLLRKCIKPLGDSCKFVEGRELGQVLSRLQCVKEAQLMSCAVATSDIVDIIEQWRRCDGDDDVTIEQHYDDVNLVMSARTSLLRMVVKRSASSGKLNEQLALHLLSCVAVARHNGRLQAAQQLVVQLQRCIERMEQRENKQRYPTTWWRYNREFEQLKLLWQQKEETFALASLRALLSRFHSPGAASEVMLRSEMLRRAGVWMEEMKYEGPDVIMKSFLQPATEHAEKVPRPVDGSLQQLVRSHHTLAKYSDRQYQEVLAYQQSTEYTQKVSLASTPKQELESVHLAGRLPSKKTQTIIEKNISIDHKEFKDVEERALIFLQTAVNSYLRCLEMSDEHNMLLHRLCALWFGNEHTSSITSLMSGRHARIASYKFIPVLYQIAARMTDSVSAVKEHQAAIKQIITRVAIDHPYHALPIILALTNAHKDDVTNSNDESKRTTEMRSILNAVRAKKKKLVVGTEALMNAYIELANFDASPWKGRPMVEVALPRTLAMSHLVGGKNRYCPDVGLAAIPTADLPIDKSLRYDHTSGVVLFTHFEPHFMTCGGINLPKVVVAVGSDGSRRKHLVKGKDDLRQDAVMQQVFEMVNTLLDKHYSSERLRVRTYRVVPLSQQSGLVEWCEGTIPIGTYLVGNPANNVLGAHERYRPNDHPVLSCRKAMTGVARQAADAKLKKFVAICSNFHPVFRHFFLERWELAEEWYARRRAYAVSVAVSSMVGYLVGLGDRHVQNILVDCETAELVHIDLGVAFEQGRCLPTPETVPFRLSRDLVDGMGSTGVEGLFRRSCERTMEVLRASYDVITPIVEVLLYDPLHDWTLPPVKASIMQHRQLDQSGASNRAAARHVTDLNDKQPRADSTNKLAERALLRLKEKLRGFELGAVVSVRGQVNLLIQQATDPARLSQLFAGWQAYL